MKKLLETKKPNPPVATKRQNLGELYNKIARRVVAGRESKNN